MTRLWLEGEPLAVQMDEAGIPVTFQWQGQQHRIQRIQQAWAIDTDWYDQRIWRNYVAVTTTRGLLCVLYQDLASQGWYMSRLYD
ncbi:hypothetical protein KFU94_37195 [Chloroflexi bacterium TSY]|uniref:hypothetical protein n=1 Tax=Candidatus Entotheonella palauensis TaxID=93172 RepID=UPI000B800B25|nr:hypothetical protein [Candidatus Entotheonella palauensis]MBV7333776.1 hypothetical protein [Chloroflexi bacterium TSY]